MARKAYAQVYSLIRHDRGTAILDALKSFASMGYSGVEGIGTNTGGMTQADYKKYLDDLGLEMPSVMLGFADKNTQAEWDFVAQMGAKYIVAGFKLLGRSRDEVLKSCDEFNILSKNIKATSGLMNLIHNHAEEFDWVDGIEGGTRIYDLLIQNTDPECVGFEIDTGWAVLGGANCEEYINKYSGRFPIVHVKECNRVGRDAEDKEHFPKAVLALGPPQIINGSPKFSAEQESMMYNARNFNVELGNGLIDWKAVAVAADTQGVDVYFVNEREYNHCYGADGDALICAQKDCDFIRSI